MATVLRITDFWKNKGNNDSLITNWGALGSQVFSLMKQYELPKIKMCTILNSGKRYVIALLNYLTSFQNIHITWMKHYIP